MLRHILPDSTNPEIIALDAALRRGDLLIARKRLTLLQTAGFSPTLGLRLGLCDYLTNDYTAAKETVARLAQADERFQPYIRFLSALIAIDLGQADVARPLLRSLGADWAAHPDKRRAVLLAEAILALYMGWYDEAAQHLEGMARRQANQALLWQRLEAQRIQGVLAYRLTDYLTAEQLLLEARSGFERIGDRYEVARSDNALADVFRRLDDYPQALQYALNAIAYFQKQEAVIPLARCRNVLGSIQHYFNQPKEALKNYQFALEHFKIAGLFKNQAWAQHNIGLIYRQMGQFKRALQAYLEAQSLASASSYPNLNAYLERSMADLVWRMGEQEKAMALMQHAGETFLNIGAIAHAANAWRSLAEYQFEQGDYAEARKLLERSSRTFLQLHRPAQATLSAIILARIEIGEGRDEQAAMLLKTAADMLLQRHMPYRAAEALTWLATIQLRQDRYVEASGAIRMARELAPQPFHEFAWRIQFILAKLALHANDLSAVRDHLNVAMDLLWSLRQAAASPASAAHLAQSAREVYARAIDLAFQQEDDASALRTLEEYKAVQFVHRLQPPLDETSAGAAISFRALDQILTPLQQLRRAIQVAREDENWQRLSQLEKEFDYQAQKLDAVQTAYSYLLRKPSLDIQQLRARLDARHGVNQWGCFVTGLIDEPGGKRKLHRFWLDSQNLLSSTSDLSAIDNHLLKLACHPEASYRQKVLDWENGQAGKIWTRLETVIIPARFRPFMQQPTSLYFSSSEELATFPFFALRLNGAPLGLQKQMTQLASLPLLQILLQQDKATDTSTLAATKGLVCAISHHQQKGFTALRHTRAEAESVYHMLAPQSVLLLDETARLADVQRAIDSQGASPFELLHFAAHARLNPSHALLSYILLYDDMLYVTDILRWRLNAKLVTLAACETAAGHSWSGDEQMGLPHAFIIAGARRVLASLWPVDDAMSAAFLQTFYQHLHKNHISVAEALQQTRVTHAKQTSSPYLWGAFTLIGLI